MEGELGEKGGKAATGITREQQKSKLEPMIVLIPYPQQNRQTVRVR